MNDTHKNILQKKTNVEILKLLRKYIDIMNVNLKDKYLTKSLYTNIKKAKKISKGIFWDYTLNDFIKTSINENKFISKTIILKINNTMNFTYQINFNFNNINFTIIINSINRININKYIEYIKKVICFCLLNIENNNKSIQFKLELFLLEDKKEITISNFNHCILPDHVNSGYTNSRSDNINIVIYRKEEWLKVFIHECLHAFNIDFHVSTIPFKKLLNDFFYVNSDFLLNEAFVEFWARIINCAFFTLHLNPSLNLYDFHNVFVFNLNIERIYSITQANKLLSIFHLDYEKIIDKKYKYICNKLYKEQTNAFCYYIIPAILMCDLENSFQWFETHNKHSFVIDKNENQVMLFIYYIKQISNSQKIRDIFKQLNINKVLTVNKMKMCMFEIDL
jgi:hypothetical protein